MSTIKNTKYQNYIPKHSISEISTSTGRSLISVLLFLLSGCTNSYNNKDAIYLELPVFETTQPEGLNLASWFVLMEAVGCLTCLCMIYIESFIILQNLTILYVCSGLSLLTILILSFTWYVQVNGTSVFLLLGMMVGELIGWVQSIFVIPYIVKNYNPRMISPFIAGNGLMVFILVILEIIQEPEGSIQFSTTVYYLIVAIIYAALICVCVYTFTSGIERLTLKEEIQILEPWRTSIYLQIVHVGWRETTFLRFTRVWMEGWTWGVITVLLPYAAENTSNSDTNDGANYLQWAIALGLLSLLLGFQSSYFAKKKFWIKEVLIVGSFGNAIILLASANIGNWSSWTMQVILMVSVCVSNWSYGWIIPLIFRDIERRFSEKSEVVARSNSIWGLIGNIFFKTFFWLISSGVLSL